MSTFESVLQTPDLGPGQSREVEVQGRRILILNIGQIYYAFEGRCPETGTQLELASNLHLVCPDHEDEYDTPSGEPIDGGGRPLRRYAVRVEGNTIKIGPPLEP